MGRRSVCAVLTVLTIHGAILLTACTDGSEPPPAVAQASEDPAAQGAAAWARGSCTTCHGPDGAGTKLGPDLTDDVWVNSDGSAEGIKAVLLAGVPKDQMKSRAWPLPMPPATVLIPQDQDIIALAAYVQSLSRSTDDE